MSDEDWILLAMLSCIVILAITINMGFKLRKAVRQGLTPDDLGYGWQTVVVFAVITTAALVWFGSLID